MKSVLGNICAALFQKEKVVCTQVTKKVCIKRESHLLQNAGNQ